MSLHNHTGSIMLQLRDAARVEYHKHLREGMKDAADAVGIALTAFKEHPTGENLAALTGVWARGVLWLSAAQGMPSPPSMNVAVAA